MSLEHSPDRSIDGALGHRGSDAPVPDCFIGIKEVCRITSLSRTTIWRLECAGKFARRRRISPNRVAWRLSEVLHWAAEREAA
jgi:predicted DNA-binding transcriptional regulator AlpA